MASLTPSQFLFENEAKPWGIQFIERIRRRRLTFKSFQKIVFILSFVAYASFHATRKTSSIVKSTLGPQRPNTSQPSNPTQSGWAPFNGPDGTSLLGEIDLAFLAVYAFGMYFAGHLGDRMDLRVFLTIGMVGTGVLTFLFGAAYWANIHSFYYFLIIQMIAGLFQATGWPSVVAVVGNWFDKKKRGLIMGIWNAHTSIGNISGSLIAAAMLKYGWGWSFALPAAFIGVSAGLVFLFLPVNPAVVGAERDGSEVDSEFRLGDTITESLLMSAAKSSMGFERRAVGFFEAWNIPGVAPFAFCLFFAKLVAYTFLYWLPFYVSHTVIDGKYLSDETSGNLSTIFDVGGVIGGILAGYVSDQLDARATTASVFMILSIPSLFIYRTYGHISLPLNLFLMFITGIFVNGPYALITTAVSADLGTHKSVRGNSRALATVTAIIDGTGSVGAAIGPLLTGYISAVSWDGVFYMLMGSALVAGLLLCKLVVAEVQGKMAGGSGEDEAERLRTSTAPVTVIYE